MSSNFYLKISLPNLHPCPLRANSSTPPHAAQIRGACAKCSGKSPPSQIPPSPPFHMQVRNVCSLLLSILDAFLSKDQTVIIRALLTLRRLLNKLDKVTYSSLCTQIASSYCPLMDHVSGTAGHVGSVGVTGELKPQLWQ